MRNSLFYFPCSVYEKAFLWHVDKLESQEHSNRRNEMGVEPRSVTISLLPVEIFKELVRKCLVLGRFSSFLQKKSVPFVWARLITRAQLLQLPSFDIVVVRKLLKLGLMAFANLVPRLESQPSNRFGPWYRPQNLRPKLPMH